MATVNKQAVAAAFGRAASGYTQHDELQRRSAELLLRQLARRPVPFATRGLAALFVLLAVFAAWIF